jgi:hypothetical protein
VRDDLLIAKGGFGPVGGRFSSPPIKTTNASANSKVTASSHEVSTSDYINNSDFTEFF